MKKFIVFLLLIAFVLSLTSCFGPDGICDHCKENEADDVITRQIELAGDNALESIRGKELCVNCFQEIMQEELSK